MRVSLLCAGLVALAACDIPAAVFDGGNQTTTSAGGSSSTSLSGSGGETTTTTTPMHTTTTDSGGGGATGGTGGTGGDTTTSTTFAGPIVPCGSPSVTCAPYQVCCYHVTDYTQDHCAAAESCDLGFFGALKCNGPEDCPGGVCCLKTTEITPLTYKDSECKGSCPAGEEVMCNPASPACGAGQTCVEMLANYDGYDVCQ